MNIGELTKFPFHANVWGTATDLGILIITTFTLWYLRKTFKSQSEIIRLQNKALESQKNVEKLEQKIFLLNIKPQINISTAELPTSYKGEDSQFKLTFEILNADAFDFNVEVVLIDEEVIQADKPTISFIHYPINVEKGTKYDIVYKNMNKKNSNVRLLELFIYYKDELKNSYRKTFKLTQGFTIINEPAIPFERPERDFSTELP